MNERCLIGVRAIRLRTQRTFSREEALTYIVPSDTERFTAAARLLATRREKSHKFHLRVDWHRHNLSPARVSVEGLSVSAQSKANRAHAVMRVKYDGILRGCRASLAVLRYCNALFEENDRFFEAVVVALGIVSILLAALTLPLPLSHVP